MENGWNGWNCMKWMTRMKRIRCGRPAVSFARRCARQIGRWTQPPILRGHSDQGHWVHPLRTPAYTQLNKNPPRTHLGSLVLVTKSCFQQTFLIVSLHLTAAAGKRNSLKSKQKWQKKNFSSMMEKNSFHPFEKDKISRKKLFQQEKMKEERERNSLHAKEIVSIVAT